MKKSKLFIFFILIVFFMLVMTIPSMAATTTSEEKTSDEGLIYVVETNSELNTAEVIIKGIKEGSSVKELTIPEQLDGEDVTIISECAFKDNTTLEKVIFPSKLTTIEKEAFKGCSNLKEVEFKNSKGEIREYAFYGTAITSLEFPKVANDMDSYGFRSTSFSGMSKLEKIIFNSADAAYIWDNDDGTENTNATDFITQSEEYFRNNVTIYGYSSSWEGEDAITCVMLSPKGFANKHGIRFVDNGTAIANLIRDKETKITVWTDVAKVATLSIKKIDSNSEVYKEIMTNVTNREVTIAYDLSIVDGDYTTPIKVDFPVDSKCNDKEAIVLHKKADGTVEKFSTTVSKGYVTVSVTELSPFIVTFGKTADATENIESNDTNVTTSTNDTTKAEETKRELDYTPKTGSIDIILIALLLIATSCACVIIVKKTK